MADAVPLVGRETETGEEMEVGGSQLVFMLFREAALGTFTLFLLVNSIWVSGRTFVLEMLLFRVVLRLFWEEYAACFAFER